MEVFAKLSHKIGDNLVRSNVIKEEDAEIYIYGINQIFVSVLNVSSALIIGCIFGVALEIAVFMAAYIPLRSFAGGYHAKTPLRCYIFSVIMLIVVSNSMKYLYLANWVHYAVLVAATLVVLVLSPVEDKNKPLDKIEHRVHKKRAIFIAVAEFLISLSLKLVGMNNLFVAMVYSFVTLNVMLVVGKANNCRLIINN